MRQAFDACNRLGRVMTVRLSEAYLNLKLDELHRRTSSRSRSRRKGRSQAVAGGTAGAAEAGAGDPRRARQDRKGAQALRGGAQ
ncbi:hypothetical protein [Piscinibacter sp.]|uniref:hypothetical protein n=1 Tax=Piscinibacter sp. TaxID=1903157 RepID=UPI0034377330